MTPQELLDSRFSGVLKSGAHAPDGQACALEFWSQVQGQEWTDSPRALVMPDLRLLNDARWSSDRLRAEQLVPVLVAVAPVWADPHARTEFVKRLTIETVRTVVGNLPQLAEDLRVRCQAVATLAEAAAAAYAASASASAAAYAAAAAAAAAAASASASASAAAYAAADADAADAAATASAAAAANAAANAAAADSVLIPACRIWINAAEGLA